TILLAPRLIKVTPSGTTVVAPLAPVTNNLTEESAVISVAAQAGKAVVEIKTTITVPDIIQQEQHGIGSGFIVRSDGYIVTNNHVVENERQLQVILRDGAKKFDARVIGTSPDDDVAVSKVEAQDLPALRWTDIDAQKVGQRDIATQLIQTGHVNRPFLGVTYNQIDETSAAASGLVVGAVVTAITPGSPADRAGIKVQDVITKVNGQSIDDSHPLKDVLRQYAP